MKINYCTLLRIALSILGFVIYFKVYVPWIIKKIDFKAINKRSPYWLIKVFVFCAFYYPFVVEMLKKSENCNIKNTGELLFLYKDYFITSIDLCLAAASFIREDMNRKKEATAAVDSMAKLKNNEEELKLNTCDKEKEQDQESK